jgi:hypothetical protein
VVSLSISITRPSGREFAAVFVFRQILGEPGLLARLVDRFEAVRGGLVRAEDAKVRHVAAHRVAQERAEHVRRRRFDAARRRNADGVVAKIGQHERLAQEAAVGVRVRADPSLAGGRERREFGDQGAAFVKSSSGR